MLAYIPYMDPMGMDIVTPPKRNVKTSLKFTTIEVGFCCSFSLGAAIFIYVYVCRNVDI